MGGDIDRTMFASFWLFVNINATPNDNQKKSSCVAYLAGVVEVSTAPGITGVVPRLQSKSQWCFLGKKNRGEG